MDSNRIRRAPLTALRRGALLACAALSALALAAGAAGAFTMSVEGAGAFSMPSLGRLTFENISLSCNVTFNGSLVTGPITIQAGRRLGSVTTGTIAGCEGGRIFSFLMTGSAPWSVGLHNVPAGLPNEVTVFPIHIESMAVNIAWLGTIECLYEAATNVLLSLAVSRTSTAGVYRTGLISILENELQQAGGSPLCPTHIELRGTFGLNPTQRITVS